MRGSAHRRSRRVAPACALLWLLGVELAPALHLALHHADHTHGADGSIIAGDDEHHHGEPDFDHTGKLVIDHLPHEAAGLAHHAVALHRPPPPPIPCAPVRALPIEPPGVCAPLTSIPPLRPTARGPPAIRVTAA